MTNAGLSSRAWMIFSKIEKWNATARKRDAQAKSLQRKGRLLLGKIMLLCISMHNTTLLTNHVVKHSSNSLVPRFNRFTYEEEEGEVYYEKNNSKIHLDDCFSLSQYYVNNVVEDLPNLNYQLCGVVHHDGETPYCGHYTACVKKKDHFVHYNDEHGERRASNYVTSIEAKQRQCYMAVYALKEDN